MGLCSSGENKTEEEDENVVNEEAKSTRIHSTQTLFHTHLALNNLGLDDQNSVSDEKSVNSPYKSAASARNIWKNRELKVLNEMGRDRASSSIISTAVKNKNAINPYRTPLKAYRVTNAKKPTFNTSRYLNFQQKRFCYILFYVL